MITAKALRAKGIGIQWVARWWYLLGFLLCMAAVVWGTVAVTPTITTFETSYTIWLPANVQQVKEIRNYFRQPGEFLQGGSGGIGNTDIAVSKEDFQRHSSTNPYNFVSVERGGKSFVVRYLSLMSHDATFILSYEEPVWSDPTVDEAWYRVRGARLEDKTVFVTYLRSDAMLLLVGFLFALAGAVCFCTVWWGLQVLFDKISNTWRTTKPWD